MGKHSPHANAGVPGPGEHDGHVSASSTRTPAPGAAGKTGAHFIESEGSEPGSTDPTAAITARGLTVTRGSQRILDGLDFQIPCGRITGLLGPSGCGKSTLMRSVVGVQAHVEGSLDVLGQSAGSSSLRRRVGYVTQAASVYTDLTAAENLRFFAKVLGTPSSAVDDALRTVALHDRADQLVRGMSGGQRSRVSLAVALLGRPDLLILDEPTVGLDPVLRMELWDMFKRLAAEGTTILVSSHVMDEAEHCERLLLMREGKLVADTTPTELKARTGCDSVESAFLEVVR